VAAPPRGRAFGSSGLPHPLPEKVRMQAPDFLLRVARHRNRGDSLAVNAGFAEAALDPLLTGRPLLPRKDAPRCSVRRLLFIRISSLRFPPTPSPGRAGMWRGAGHAPVTVPGIGLQMRNGRSTSASAAAGKGAGMSDPAPEPVLTVPDGASGGFRQLRSGRAPVRPGGGNGLEHRMLRRSLRP
jgi:hypothetical protein